MLARANELNGSRLEADLCVVGAGAAGIAIARQFQDQSKLRVVLLESGDREPEARTQALYEGDWLAPVGADDYLVSSRNRSLGGTTTLWSGTCRPHDPIDFEERPWVPDSGWPLRREDLIPYYERAAELLEVRPLTDDGPDGALFPFSILRGEDEPVFVPKILHISRPTRFDQAYAPALVASEAVHLVLRANVVDIRRVSPESPVVDRVEVESLDGSRFSVRAPFFVLATGTFENARILLNCRTDRTVGLGNEHDNVGRYYMDHAHPQPTGLLSFSNETGLQQNVQEATALGRRLGHGFYFLYSPTREVQEREKLLNGALRLAPLQPDALFGPDVELAEQVHRLACNLAAGGARLDAPATGTVLAFKSYPEEAPNRESRVVLSDETDELGQRRIDADWRPTEQTRGNTGRLLELCAREAGRLGFGRVCVQLLDGVYGEKTTLWNHPSGTTRMHLDPKRGVTDANGRVHGTSNLFVAGSSLFPTEGFANPTMTLVALALRQADHLEALAGGSAS